MNDPAPETEKTSPLSSVPFLRPLPARTPPLPTRYRTLTVLPIPNYPKSFLKKNPQINRTIYQKMAEQEQIESVLAVESTAADHSSSEQSQSQSSSSLSRNVSFSKLNAQAPAFVPTRPQSQSQQPPQPPPPRLAVIPPPPPPPAAATAMLHMYPPSPFHVPIHSPVHVLPVQNHHHNHHHNLHDHHHNHHHQHNQQHQQYVPVRIHNQHHQQYHNHNNQNSKRGGQQQQQAYEEDVEVVGNKDGVAALPDHAPAKNNNGDTKADISKNGISDEAINKLLNQVEYYFSDLNLATTDHLMRFITKDPQGYVPLSVVSSFKKVKAAITSNSQLATILRNSTKLVVSEDRKKVKRLHPLTESDVEELQSRVVVAENLPEDHCHQNLMKIFSAVGSVKTIRTCPPQTSSGGASSTSRSAKADGLHFSNKLHAFVEYETVEIAEKAVAELNDERNWRSGLRVRLMLKHMPKSIQARGKKGHDGQGHSEEDEVSASDQMPNGKQMEDPSQQYDAHSNEYSGEDHANDKEGAQRKGRNRGRGKGRGRGQYHHTNNHHNNRGNHVGTPPSSNPIIGEQPLMAKQPPGPRMPDGTRGFAMGRGKPVAVNIA